MNVATIAWSVCDVQSQVRNPHWRMCVSDDTALSSPRTGCWTKSLVACGRSIGGNGSAAATYVVWATLNHHRGNESNAAVQKRRPIWRRSTRLVDWINRTTERGSWCTTFVQQCSAVTGMPSRLASCRKCGHVTLVSCMAPSIPVRHFLPVFWQKHTNIFGWLCHF